MPTSACLFMNCSRFSLDAYLCWINEKAAEKSTTNLYAHGSREIAKTRIIQSLIKRCFLEDYTDRAAEVYF